MFGFDPLYFILALPGLALALIAQMMVKSAFARYSRASNRNGLSGADVAQAILDAHGIRDVRVMEHHGFLSDHYNPMSKTLALSPPVFHGRSIASVGVAAHEVGHALQHARGYLPLQVRSALVPVANLGSNLAPILFMIGLFFAYQGGSTLMAEIGILVFGAAVLFTLVTLPVEFNASSRALAILDGSGILTADEMPGARAMLRAAALTYVAAAVAAILQLLYMIIRLRGARSRD